MKPWTEKKAVLSALANEGVRVGERTLPSGARLRGLYAARNFAPGDWVASFSGRVISRAELFALHDADPALFALVNEYGVATKDGGHLYPPDPSALGGHLANHACGPNATMSGRWERGALLLQAERPISAGEEVTVHYHWTGVKAATEGRAPTPCACQSARCCGTIELALEAHEEKDADGGVTLALFLPPEEVENRIAADVVNAARANEATILQYARNAHLMFSRGEARRASWADEALLGRIADAVRAAAAAGLGRGAARSHARLAELVGRYL